MTDEDYELYVAKFLLQVKELSQEKGVDARKLCFEMTKACLKIAAGENDSTYLEEVKNMADVLLKRDANKFQHRN